MKNNNKTKNKKKALRIIDGNYIHCEKCGTTESKGAKYCSICGYEVKEKQKEKTKESKPEIEKISHEKLLKVKEKPEEKESKEPNWIYCVCWIFFVMLIVYMLFFEKGFANN